jgi:hypothetical protein
MNRTHWAVKGVNLPKELHSARGITLPSWARDITRSVDVSTHAFEVALSFPGEERPVIEQVAAELERRLGPHSYFYDSNYVSQLARPSLDILLQGPGFGRTAGLRQCRGLDGGGKCWRPGHGRKGSIEPGRGDLNRFMIRSRRRVG